MKAGFFKLNVGSHPVLCYSWSKYSKSKTNIDQIETNDSESDDIISYDRDSFNSNLNNSKTVKSVTLAFCSIQKLLIRDIHTNLGIPNLSQSPDIGKNSDGSISDFWISGQFLISSKTSDDIDMKLGSVTKIDKRKTKTTKKFHDDVMSANCDVIIIFAIYSQFGTIWILDSTHMVCKCCIVINGKLLSCKNWKQNFKKISSPALMRLLWVSYYFCQKMLICCQKLLTSAKLRRSCTFSERYIFWKERYIFWNYAFTYQILSF